MKLPWILFAVCLSLLIGTALQFAAWAMVFQLEPEGFLCWKHNLQWVFQVIYWILLVSIGILSQDK